MPGGLTSKLCWPAVPRVLWHQQGPEDKRAGVQRMQTSSPGPTLWRGVAQGHYHCQHLQVLIFLLSKKAAGPES